jgi:hypothetical protein
LKKDEKGKPIISQEELSALVRKFGERIHQWVESHGSLNGLPVFQDEKTGEWIWIDRKARRKLEQRNRRKFKHLYK